MVDYYSLSEKDRQILEKLQSFIPEKIFDAHAHLHALWHVPEEPNLFSDYGVADAKAFLRPAPLMMSGVRASSMRMESTSSMIA